MERLRHWLRQVEAKLDDWGRPGWLGAMVIGFLVFPPLGLFILGYMIWSKRMRCKAKRSRRHGMMRGETGNSAFDEYRRETLQRLEDEREAFTGFLTRLREAKDKAEFDQFMTERTSQPSA